MPEQVTGWKVRVWGMGHGTKVGEGTAEIVTKKDLIVRLQAPRFASKPTPRLSAAVGPIVAVKDVEAPVEFSIETVEPAELPLA